MHKRTFVLSGTAIVILAGATAGYLTVPRGANDGAAAAQATSTTQATSTSVASSAQWAAQGTQLKQFALAGTDDTYNKTYKNGDWAYRSLSTNITGDGTYVLDFGPVDPSFDYPLHPTGISYDWPPDTDFSVTLNSVTDATIAGKKYFQADITVSHFFSSYPGFNAWIY